MVARPASFSLAELRSYPSRSQITQLACEEGWSFIAEWTGVPLSHVLNVVGTAPASPVRGLLFRYSATGGTVSTWPMHCIPRLFLRTE